MSSGVNETHQIDGNYESNDLDGINFMQDAQTNINKRKAVTQDIEGPNNPIEGSNKRLLLQEMKEQEKPDSTSNETEAKVKLKEASTCLAKLNDGDRDRMLQWFMSNHQQNNKETSNTTTSPEVVVEDPTTKSDNAMIEIDKNMHPENLNPQENSSNISLSVPLPTIATTSTETIQPIPVQTNNIVDSNGKDKIMAASMTTDETQEDTLVNSVFDETIFQNLDNAVNFSNTTTHNIASSKLPNPTPFPIQHGVGSGTASTIPQVSTPHPTPMPMETTQIINIDNLKRDITQHVLQQVIQNVNQQINQIMTAQINQINQHISHQVSAQVNHDISQTKTALNGEFNQFRINMKREVDQIRENFKVAVRKFQEHSNNTVLNPTFAVARTVTQPVKKQENPSGLQLNLTNNTNASSIGLKTSTSLPQTKVEPATQATNVTTQMKEPIKKPHDNDVLSGRGNGSNLHKGNIAFRDLIQQYKFRYISATENDKKLISNMIIQEITNKTPPGRFLKKDTATGHWQEIDKRVALKKTSQALREGAPDLRTKIGTLPEAQTNIRVSIGPDSEAFKVDPSVNSFTSPVPIIVGNPPVVRTATGTTTISTAEQKPVMMVNSAQHPQQPQHQPQPPKEEVGESGPIGKNGEPQSNDVADVLLSLSSRGENGNETTV